MDLLENYEEIKHLGSGAQGEATLVRYIPTNEECVLKKISLRNIAEGDMKKCLMEAETLSKCYHDNVIKYYASFQNEGNLFIVMEYANGGELADLIELRKRAGQPFTDDEVRKYSLQLLNALAHVHQCNIIHRDVKPQNVFVHTVNGETMLKLADFGVSKSLTATTQMAVTCIGTPLYLAAEMLLKPDDPYTCLVDIWSAGCVIYELCTLKLPYKAGNIMSLISKLRDEEAQPVKRPVDIYEVVTLALQKDATKRASANALIAILTGKTKHDVVQVEPVSKAMKTEDILMEQRTIELGQKLEVQNLLVTLTTGKKFGIQCRHTDQKQWDVMYDSRKKGANIINYDPNHASNQEYTFQLTKTGMLITVQSTMLQIGVKKDEAFQPILQLSSSSLYNSWEIVHNQYDSGWYYIRLANTNLYITLEGANSTNLSKFVLGELTGGFHQMFRFIC